MTRLRLIDAELPPAQFGPYGGNGQAARRLQLAAFRMEQPLECPQIGLGDGPVVAGSGTSACRPARDPAFSNSLDWRCCFRRLPMPRINRLIGPRVSC